MNEPTDEQIIDSEDMQELSELQQEQNEEVLDSSFPQVKKQETLYSLFQRVWRTQDSSKVSNLDKFELGKLGISVRDSQYLHLLGKTMRHEKFAKFWKDQGEIILSTSASKKGWLAELFVSQKKFTQRASSVMGQNNNSQKKDKWNFFGQNGNQEQQQQEQ